MAEGSEYNNVFKQYLLRLHRLFVMTNKRVLKFWLYSDFIYKMTGEKKRLDEEAKHLTALSESVRNSDNIDMLNVPTYEYILIYIMFVKMH